MSLYGRLFAAIYDTMLAGTEKAGLRERRRALLTEASGRVLEIGAGTGVNIDLYPPGVVDQLVLSEPEAPMARRCSERAAPHAPWAQVVHAPAERLPFEDASFDTVVATLVLCTVSDLDAAVAEARRVLRPGGRLLFLEHVRSEDEASARWQDRLHGPWKAFGHGCNANRRTLAAIESAAFTVERVERDEVPKAPPIVRPMVVGVARAS